MDGLRQLWAIGLVFGLLWAALWALKKKGSVGFRQSNSGTAGNTLESLGRLRLSPQHSLHWVRIGERNLLVGVHPAGITPLGDLAPASACAKPEPRLQG